MKVFTPFWKCATHTHTRIDADAGLYADWYDD